MNELLTCTETWRKMTALTADGTLVRNFSQRISMTDYTVETDLFPREALQAYSAWNLGLAVSPEMKQKYFSAHRGGSQGDYREHMPEKIANVVDCLARFPGSKRAVITIPNNPLPSHISDDDAKCMRELHFYLDGSRLSATVFFRAQAAEIFPKNIHFVGSLMDAICRALPGGNIARGELFYLATTLVSDRT